MLVSEQVDCDKLWIDKYEPTTMNDLIVNKNIIANIKKWIEKFGTDDNIFSSMLLCGNPGSGKNVSLKILFKSLNYDIKILSACNIKNKKIIQDLINSHDKKYNLSNQTIDKKKLALIIEDTDVISLGGEKECLLELCKSNNKDRLLPIIFIANNQRSKLITNIQKICIFYDFLQPTKDDLVTIINKITKAEKITISCAKVYDMIIHYTQYDIRRLIFLLQDIYMTFKTSKEIVLNVEMLQRYLNNFQKKDVDIALFDATRLLLNEYKSINNCMLLYETNKVILPLTIHQNYHCCMFARTKYLNLNKQNPTKLLMNQLDICRRISDSSSIGDVIETNIYTDQNWVNRGIHGFYTVCDSSYTLNSIINSCITTETPHTLKSIKNPDYTIEHSMDLHKTSLKNINKKQIAIFKAAMPLKTFDEILYINKIMYDLSYNEKYEEAFELCKGYSIDMKLFEIITKIDKTYAKLAIKIKKNKKLK